MGNDKFVDVVQRRLSVAIDMGDNAAKDFGLIARFGAQFNIEVL